MKQSFSQPCSLCDWPDVQVMMKSCWWARVCNKIYTVVVAVISILPATGHRLLDIVKRVASQWHPPSFSCLPFPVDGGCYNIFSKIEIVLMLLDLCEPAHTDRLQTRVFALIPCRLGFLFELSFPLAENFPSPPVKHAWPSTLGMFYQNKIDNKSIHMPLLSIIPSNHSYTWKVI